ncbi:alanine--glyoxylate aminotransferase family protein [Candidatus Desantisbacteria bacterium]|nr:alanine--glyoxylate aminotransferase family protein [Candidatus Desantisbacteria bacterium]
MLVGKKYYLMSPGPTSVPPEVSLAEAQPIIHHRTPAYEEIFAQVNENLRYLFQTTRDVYTLASSGTGAMEAAVVNLLSAGDLALVVNAGKFGERWGKICKAYGVNTIQLNVEWGYAVTPEQIAEKLKENPEIKVVFATLCETSTATLLPIKEIGKVVSKTDACLVVDAVSGMGVEEFKTDEWHVDVVTVGSQKGMMIPPGLGFITMSEKAWGLAAKSTLPKFYFSLAAAKKNLVNKQTPYTPAVSLIYALQQALKMMKQEGIENIWKRHQMLAEACQAGVKALGLEILSKSPANGVTAVVAPAEIDGKAIIKGYKEQGIIVAGGQDHLKNKIVRIAHMGYAGTFDVLTAIAALEMILAKSTYNFDKGAGIKAAEEVFLRS